MKISFREAVKQLKLGNVVAVPTETVYGLAASIENSHSVQKIFFHKKRPQDNPLIVHIANIRQLHDIVTEIPEAFYKLKSFWPGPLTIVFKANKKTVPSVVRAGLDTVAVRMPKHELFIRLLKQTGPLAAPSANLSGKPSATSVKHVHTDFGLDFPVLDGGRTHYGVESTVIQLKKSGWQYLRAGAISETSLQQILGPSLKTKTSQKRPRTPGAKYKHYSPAAKLTFCASSSLLKRKSHSSKFDAVLGFSDTTTTLPLLSLGPRNRHIQNLKNLYQRLRQIDELHFQTVLVDGDITAKGLGITLLERLQKACGST